jgi:hypothetical protein
MKTSSCDKDLAVVSNKNFTKLDFSFRTIALELKLFINEVKSHPIIKKYLKDPYNQDRESMRQFYLIYTAFANKYVNNRVNVSSNIGKRITIVNSAGRVAVDVTTFIPNSVTWLNYNMTLGTYSHVYDYKDSADIDFVDGGTTVQSDKVTFNPNGEVLKNILTTPVSETYSMRVGSTDAPNMDVKNITSQNSKGITFQHLENHNTRKEIQDAFSENKKYNCSSRFSDTVYTQNFYVATKLAGNDGQEFVVRFAYFKLN